MLNLMVLIFSRSFACLSRLFTRPARLEPLPAHWLLIPVKPGDLPRRRRKEMEDEGE